MSNEEPQVPTRDPRQSIRALSGPVDYQEANITFREHQETNIHYIGEALPVPSDVMMQADGVANAAGSSPFPARADHTHAQKNVFGIYNSASVTVPPSTFFFNNIAYLFGRNMLSSGQVLAFPFNGLFMINANIIISRVGGGIFTGQMNIIFSYSNASVARRVFRGDNSGIPTDNNISVTDYFFTTTAPSANDNLQISIQHNDSVSWNIYINQLVVTRVGGTVSN